MMRLMLTLLCVYSFINIQAESQTFSAEESFLQANTLYHQQAWARALEKYNAIPSKSSGVLYNIGNCYYYLGQYSRAIAYWLKAKHNTTSWNMLSDIDYNINVAYTTLGISSEKKWSAALTTFFDYLTIIIPPIILQLIELIFLILIFIFIVIRSRRYVVLGIIVSIGLCNTILLSYMYYQYHHKTGIVVEKMVSVYSGPGSTYSEIGNLKDGDQLSIGNQEDTWYKITHHELSGWVQGHFVEII